MAPGSLQGLQFVVDDVEAARDELSARALEGSDVQDFPWGRFVFFGPRRQLLARTTSGSHAERAYRSNRLV
jgi:hypothetical protein